MPLFLMILYFSGKMEFRGQLEEATTELNSRFAALEASEKNSVTLALTEQRGHLCHLISCVKPLVVSHVFSADKRHVIWNFKRNLVCIFSFCQ